MKYLVLALALLVVSGNVSLNEYGTGQSCSSDGGFTISSFTISPFPPVACNPQAITANGTFTGNYCPNQIHIHEVYNQRQAYDQYISISGCYTNGQQVSMDFIVNPVQCNSGSYLIQVSLQQQTPQLNLCCWQYTYSL